MQATPYFGRYAMLGAQAYPQPHPGAYAVYAAPTLYYYNPPAQPGAVAAAAARSERERFYEQLHAFRASIGQPISRLPTLGFKELDLWTLYREVTRRRGIDAVIARKQWKEVAEALHLPSSCTDSGFRLRLHYKKYLEAFERKFFTPQHTRPAPPSPRPAAARRRKRRAPPPAVSDEDAAAASLVAMPSRYTPPAPRSVGGSASTLCSIVVGEKHEAPLAEPPTSPCGSCSGAASERSSTRPDFSQLSKASLLRYARKHGLPEQDAVVDVVSDHFRKRDAPDDEEGAIGAFLGALRKKRRFAGVLAAAAGGGYQ